MSGKIKSKISLMLAVVMLLSVIGTGSVIAADYDNHWVKEDVKLLLDKGYLTADSDGNVSPDAAMPRGEFVTLVNKICGYTAKADSNFADVTTDSKYYDAFLIAKAAGYIQGDANGNATPGATVTRGEVAVILARIYKYDTAKGNTSKYSEADVPAWAMGAVAALETEGVMKGNPDGTFAGYKMMTNAEGYTMAARLVRKTESPKPSNPTTIYTPEPRPEQIVYTHTPQKFTPNLEWNINVKVNGKTVSTDVQPIYEDGTLFASAESMAEFMFLTFYELTDGTGFVLKNQYATMTAKYGQNKVTMQDGKTIDTVNPHKVDVRNYLPLDTVMYAFNAKYTWDAQKNSANVEMNPYFKGSPQQAGQDRVITKGVSRDGYYIILTDDPNAEVTVWRLSGERWVPAPKPYYRESVGGFSGSSGYIGSTFKVNMKSRGVEEEFSFYIGGEDYKEKPHEFVVPKAPDLLLRTTFTSISMYLDCEVEGLNTVKYRKKGDSDWKYGFRMQYDDLGKQWRGSIVNLTENTTYEVMVILSDSKGENKKEYTSEITTWKEDVPIAKTIDIKELYEPGKPVSIQRIEGTEDGWIKIVGDGKTVIDVSDEFSEAVAIGNCKYLILENLIVRGGAKHGMYVMGSNENIRITNCDFSKWGRVGTFNAEDGLYYSTGKSPINNDGAVYMGDVKNFVVEKSYFHDPKGRSNAWSGPEWSSVHPQGPNGIYGRGNQGVVIRYNDFVGSDEHRWNDSVETFHNFGKVGGIGWDSDMYGNYQVFGQDDSTELDGTQMNVRYYGNKVEGFLCGVSTAGTTVGPSYIFRNLIVNLGDDRGKTGSAMKNGHADPNIAIGFSFFFHNNMIGSTGINQTGTNYRPFSRNNIIQTGSPNGNAGTATQDNDKISLEYDLIYGKENNPYGRAMFSIDGKASFVDALAADFRIVEGSLGIDKGQILANFSDGYKGTAPDMGAVELGDDTIFPIRPTALRSNKYQVNLSGSSAEKVVIKVGNVPAGTTYKILKNEVFDWFDVMGPQEGQLTPNSQLEFTVTGNFDKVGTDYQGNQYRRGNGAFLIKMSDGHSLPITVYLTK